MFRTNKTYKLNHQHREPAARHIPAMQDQHRMQRDQRKIKRPERKKRTLSTVELLVHLYLRLNHIAHAMYYKNTAALSSSKHSRDYRGTAFFDAERYLPDLCDAENPPVILSRYYAK